MDLMLLSAPYDLRDGRWEEIGIVLNELSKNFHIKQERSQKA